LALFERLSLNWHACRQGQTVFRIPLIKLPFFCGTPVPLGLWNRARCFARITGLTSPGIGTNPQSAWHRIGAKFTIMKHSRHPIVANASHYNSSLRGGCDLYPTVPRRWNPRCRQTALETGSTFSVGAKRLLQENLANGHGRQLAWIKP
jgi:hypothetical protein